MANIDLYIPRLHILEGGFSDRKEDRGGPTQNGVTLNLFKKIGWDKDGDGDIDIHDLKLLTVADRKKILKENFWDKWRADDIHNQVIAEFLVDWIFTSWMPGFKKPQEILVDVFGFVLMVDGVVGPLTVRAINLADPVLLFFKLKESRLNFMHAIVKNDPSQKANLNGWINRVNSFTYKNTIA
jgi:lysozyme family protein